MTFEEWYKSVYGVYPNEVLPNTDADYQVQIARVTKLNQKMIKVQRFPKAYRDGKGRNKYAHDAIKLDPEDVAIHVLQGGE